MHGVGAIMPSIEAVTFLANLAVAVSLVCGVGILAARACRRGPAPLRHGILVWTLGLTLVSPAAVWLAQRNGLALVRITVSGPPNAQQTAIAGPRLPATLPSAASGSGAGGEGMGGLRRGDRGLAAGSPYHGPLPPQAATGRPFRPDHLPGGGRPDARIASEGSSSSFGNLASASEQLSPPVWWHVIGSIAALLWAIGTALGLLHLAWGCATLARFRCRLDPLVDPRQKLLVEQAADAVRLRKLPAVFLSRSLGVPVSIGLLKPAIVLPEVMPREADENQLQAILVHEMAHIARHDHWVGVGQQIAAAMFWWNPLVRWTCDGISDVREEICDNHVVLVQGEGRRLARILVDWAARVAAAPLLPSTVGVLGPRPAGLAGRVARLLEKERNMETRMNLRSRVFLFACGLAALVGMASVGGLRLAHAQPASKANPAAAEEAAQASSNAAETPGQTPGALAARLAMNASKPDAHNERFDFRGQVLDPDGKPLPGAKVYIVFHPHAREQAPPPKVRAITGPDGAFYFSMDKSEFDRLRASQLWNDIEDDVDYKNDSRLVAVADGYGPAWQPAFAFDGSGQVLQLILEAHPQDSEALKEKRKPVLKLVGDVPLVGRIVDTAGKPIAGVNVRVLNIDTPKDKDLTGWLNAATKEDADMDKLLRYFSQAKVAHGTFTDNGMSSNEFPQLMPTAISDADGNVRLSGVGRERIAGLLIDGPGIASAVDVSARTRPGPTLVIPIGRRFPTMGVRTCFGSDFQYVARPSVPIVGTVQDKDTGKPMSGVTIQGYKLAGIPAPDYVVRFYFKTTTDDQGRYRLTGLPVGKDNALLAVPPKDEPYLLSKKRADTAGAEDPSQVDFELKRGIWIRGRITDAKTGAPVPSCAVDYYVFLDNPYWKSAPGFQGAYQYFSYLTDHDGRYALPGLPGRGILAVQVCSKQTDRYPLRVGVEKIPELRNGGGTFDKVAPRMLYTYGMNVLAEVDLAEGAEAVEHDFQLDPGETLTGTVLDPAGKPLAGAQYSGLIDRNYWNPLRSSTFTVNCYRPDHPRKLLFVHLERKLAGSRVVEGPQTGPIRVQLQPWGVVTGRVVDADGKPLTGVQMTGQDLPNYLWQRDPGGQFHYLDWHFLTDPNGRFRIEGLAPGITYNLSAWDKPPGTYLANLISAVTVEPGQTKDLGDLTVKPRNRPRR